MVVVEFYSGDDAYGGPGGLAISSEYRAATSGLVVIFPPSSGSSSSAWAPSLLSHKRKSSPLVGLRNLGNTCYLNSVSGASPTPLLSQIFVSNPFIPPPVMQPRRSEEERVSLLFIREANCSVVEFFLSQAG
nr:ubiquitin carboxyl-terminal hydrolase 25 [Ipomoea batatas]